MQQHQVGRHSFWVEGDVVYIKYVSSVSLAEMKQMDEINQPMIGDLPAIYLVYDVSEAGLMTPEARRYAAERSKDLRCAALLVHGTTLFTRAAIALVMSAVRLIGKDVPEMVYLKNEQEAREWIAAHRKGLSRK